MLFGKGGHIAATEKWFYHRTEIEIVNSSKYLGYIYTLTNKLSSHVACRCIATKRRENLRPYMSLGSFDSSLFFKLFDCQVKPMLLYASEISIYLSICHIILWTVGAPHDVTPNLRHSSLSSAFLTVSLSPKPVHSQMLSSHRFLCLPLLLPPCSVPWWNVFARPEDLVMCPYHCSLRCFTMVKSSL